MSFTKKIPVFILNKQVLFPGFTLKIELKKELVDSSFLKYFKKEGNKIITVPLAINSNEDNNFSELKNQTNRIGTLAEISNFSIHGNYISLILRGVSRITVSNFEINKLILQAEYKEVIEYNAESEITINFKNVIRGALLRHNRDFKQIADDPLINSSNSVFADSISMILHFSYEENIILLSENNVEKRLAIILEIVKRNFDHANNVNREVETKLRLKLTKQQKEFYLKEQMKIIKEELDEITGQETEVKSFRKKIENNPYPKRIKEKALKEVQKLENTPSMAPESGIIKNYLDWLLELPYWQKDNEEISIKDSLKILNREHFGLEKPKERILEYLAVKKQNPNSKGAIIALIGPPGTGKTSFAKSIANSLNRKFVKISLGGIKDESEIRGHRRTYIGAMPGKIIQAMKKAGVINPIILLDEIDKMSSDFRGDPTAALLEVLDYEQNNRFQDHFLEEDYDLSQVIFIATANYIQEIPEPLYDRLELINLSSYTEIEKLNIAKKYLIPRTLKNTLLPKSYFHLTDKNIKFIIRHYTMEAGVRQLQRVLETLARKILVKKLSELDFKGIEINDKNIEKFLGPKKYDFTKKDKEPQIGTTTGLAWTSYGGDILPIEVVLSNGKGKLTLTGQLKNVMKESSEIALSYVKANYDKFNIPLKINNKKTFEDFDIHIHSPDGATPKDGPSAGVTFTTSIISALTKKPISQNIGMTGEITLRGKILPIGGLKEKSISAYRSGLKLIFIPKENIKDLVDVPNEVKQNLKIVPVSNYIEIFEYLNKHPEI